jgi:glycyl-tRNA synthetase
VLKLDARLAPVKAAILPLSKSSELAATAQALRADLAKTWHIDYDEAGAIGRRYRRQDEIGTPFAVTVDFETASDQAVTIRDRDSMSQERVNLGQVKTWLSARLGDSS